MTGALSVVGVIVAVAGASLILLAALGLHRVDGPSTRLHVAAKASSSGILLTLAGVGVASANVAVALELLLTGAFLLLTVPLATHALAWARQRAEDARTGTQP